MKDANDGLSACVRETRVRHGVSADDFAMALGVSPEQLAAIEAGISRPGVDVLLGMLLTFDIDPRELHVAASSDRRVARLLANLPRLRELYGAVVSGRPLGHSSCRPGGRLRQAELRQCGSELVEIRVSDQSFSLWWDVDHVSADALSSVKELLATGHRGDRSIVLNFLKLGWATERYARPLDAIARIKQVQDLRGVAVLPVTRVQRLALTDVTHCARLLRLALSAWSGPEPFERLLAGPFSRYGLFFSRPGADGALTFSHVGASSACAQMLGQDWRDSAKGTLSDSAFADAQFDRRVSASYEQSLTSGKAVLEHIVGLIDMGSHHVWLPYQRLLLPDGNRLACFTKITQYIACPPFARAN